ncbi:MAG TPA: hypothetical protein VFE60_21135 [Roseiarcus sp.]|nr:hypothetical protein [Roseiarcus sp.]
MKDYNGFTGEQRGRAQSWLNAQWRSGAIARPLDCCACGQAAQPIDAHAEDYSEPFRKDVTDGFHLCFICHMMVHCRHRSQEAWRLYRHMVESGGRAIPVGGRHFPAFQQKFLTGKITPGLFEWFDPPERQALREIELSQDEAAKRAARIA